jgi:hypothetical protein
VLAKIQAGARTNYNSLTHRPISLAYNTSMRRALSFALLLLFSFPLILPLLAITAGSEANLPACCRRNGAHHCIGKMQPASSESGTNLSGVPQRCSAFPAAITQARHSDLSFQSASLIFAEIISHPAIKPQIQARARVAFDRSRQQRGPPTQLL